ncbi:ATP-binding protein [Nocardioides bruguierae]|uniref:ATP-binding protein n=1 Tax=Nocardioides bruguierae TaxID=2945102 RepID=UPI00201FE36C|nr:ATP-binding protein [Nocardioides bruguierae]MCL8026456.1 ATP-binding protein [Nocardioides bruguierae]
MSTQPTAPLTTSADGRAADLAGLRVTPGDLLVAEAPLPVLLQAVTASTAVVLGALPAAGSPGEPRLAPDVAPFEDVAVRPASSDEVGVLQATTRADLPIGRWDCGDADTAASLRSSGFNRHTFLCGQSGSGKTYALGVLLEQLLIGTGLPMVILDPNADFVHLGTTRPDAEPTGAAIIEGTEVRVLGSNPPEEPLRMRFATMPRAAQAAVLRLDPLRDRAEYNLFVTSFGRDRPVPAGVDAYVTSLLAGHDDERALGQRVQNLGLTDWEVWALDQASAAEVALGGARATVVDLAGLADPREASAVCLDLVERLWAARHERRPMLIVIDEAHNVCPAEPHGEVQERLVERLIQIAAEGRKYGLWLLLSTQRPSKVHQQVVSQCDNLMLMRMNSPADVADVATLFGFAPPEMIARAPSFRQGEAVAAGRFAPCPMRVRMGDRLTVEGGSDVAVPPAPTR